MAVEANDTTFLLSARLMSDVGLACALLMCAFLLAGVCGNSIAFYIFTRPHFRTTSINVLLAALAVSDNLLLVLAVPVFAVHPFCIWLDRPPSDRLVSFILGAYPLVVMAQCCTIWLLVVITAERWLVVCRPLHARYYLSRYRALVLIALVLASSVAYNLVRFWEFTKHRENGTDVVLVMSNLRANSVYILWYQNVLGSLSMFLIPLSMLLLLSYKVARQTAISRRERIRMSRRQCSQYKTARMMFNIVMVFLCCYGASFVLGIVEMFSPEFSVSPVGYLLNNINNTLVTFNSTCNGVFYWRYCSRFRKEINLKRFESLLGRNRRRQDSVMLKLTPAAALLCRRAISMPSKSAQNCLRLYRQRQYQSVKENLPDATQLTRRCNNAAVSVMFHDTTRPNQETYGTFHRQPSKAQRLMTGRIESFV